MKTPIVAAKTRWMRLIHTSNPIEAAIVLLLGCIVSALLSVLAQWATLSGLGICTALFVLYVLTWDGNWITGRPRRASLPEGTLTDG